MVTALAAFGVFGSLILITIGLLVGRPDLVVLGIPVILTTVWGIAAPPRGLPEVSLGRPRAIPDVNEVEANLLITPAGGVPSIRVRVTADAHRPIEATIDARRPREVRLSLRTVRTGRRRMFQVDYVAHGTDTVYRTEPHQTNTPDMLLLPRAGALREVPIPFQLHGLTGAHGSRRAGEGGDFRDVAVFGPGDRLRRIDWKTTARRRGATSYPELYVRRNHATADAHVMLVLDPRDNVGPDVESWSTGQINPMDASALDIARNAAATLARHYLRQGDRVGLVDMARGGRTLLPASGRRHLDRLAHHLAMAEPDGESRRYIRAPQIPSGAMVVVFSTFLDDIYSEIAQKWRHEGHRVLAVDVLPQPDLHALNSQTVVVFRMLWMERLDRLAALRSSGVELVRWQARGDDPDPVETLAAMSRMQRRRR